MSKTRKGRKAAAGGQEGEKAKTRDPFAPHLRQRGHGVEPPGKTYKRRPKHPKPPSKDGGFSYAVLLGTAGTGVSRSPFP